jgi:hypothetical protein
MDEKINELRKRIDALEEGLTEEDQVLVRVELDALITGMNTEIEEYLVKMKTLEIKQD